MRPGRHLHLPNWVSAFTLAAHFTTETPLHCSFVTSSYAAGRDPGMSLEVQGQEVRVMIECKCVSGARTKHSRFQCKVGILIPAYNEAAHLPKLLKACRAVEPAVILVVDDCSTDRTQAVVAEADGVITLRNHRNLGKQGSVRRGLRELISHDIDAIALIDGDGQHDPAELPRLAALLDEYHFVIGARSRDEMPIQRQLSNLLVNLGFQLIGGVDFIDVQSGLRLYRKELAKVLAERLPVEGGYALEHESLTLLTRWATETGTTLRAAAALASCSYGQGTSSMGPWHIAQLAFETIRQSMRLRLATVTGGY
jgi:hypothetical protein